MFVCLHTFLSICPFVFAMYCVLIFVCSLLVGGNKDSSSSSSSSHYYYYYYYYHYYYYVVVVFSFICLPLCCTYHLCFGFGPCWTKILVIALCACYKISFYAVPSFPFDVWVGLLNIIIINFWAFHCYCSCAVLSFGKF